MRWRTNFFFPLPSIAALDLYSSIHTTNIYTISIGQWQWLIFGNGQKLTVTVNVGAVTVQRSIFREKLAVTDSHGHESQDWRYCWPQTRKSDLMTSKRLSRIVQGLFLRSGACHTQFELSSYSHSVRAFRNPIGRTIFELSQWLISLAALWNSFDWLTLFRNIYLNDLTHVVISLNCLPIVISLGQIKIGSSSHSGCRWKWIDWLRIFRNIYLTDLTHAILNLNCLPIAIALGHFKIQSVELFSSRHSGWCRWTLVENRLSYWEFFEIIICLTRRMELSFRIEALIQNTLNTFFFTANSNAWR